MINKNMSYDLWIENGQLKGIAIYFDDDEEFDN
jgi:hypothetical protein